MPWAAIVVAVISFIITYLANGHKAGTAALVAAGAGLGTYALSNSSLSPAWLSQADGIPSTGNSGTSASTGTNYVTGVPGQTGSASTNTSGQLISTLGSTTSALGGDVSRTLSSWGGVGTSAVIGTAAVASSSGFSSFISKYGVDLLIGGVAIFALKEA